MDTPGTFFDRQGTPMTAREWAVAFEDVEGRVVERTRVGKAVVLTVWVGYEIDPLHEGPPRIFTSVIECAGEFVDETSTPTESGARSMHAFFVELAKGRY